MKPPPPSAPDVGLPALATFLCQQREHITALWMAAVRENPRIASADPLDFHELADHLPVLFDDMADLLRGESTDGKIIRDAASHGVHRWQQEYSLDELIRELGIVSATVLEHGLEAFEDEHPDTSRAEMRRARRLILQFFENTVTGSVKQYVDRQNTERESLHSRLRTADQALAASVQSERDQLEEIFRRSPSFMAVVRGPDHVFVLANTPHHQLVGNRDLLNKPMREAIPEAVEQGFVARLDRVYATGEPFVANDQRVFLRSHPDQPPVEHYLDLVYQPTRSSEGKIDGVFIHGVERTTRHLAQETSAKIAEQHRLALDSAQMGWWHYDVPSDTVHWDERLQTIFGLGKKLVPYEEVISRVHPEDRQRLSDLVAASIRPHDPVPCVIEYRVVHDDGTVRWVAARGQPAFEGEGAERRCINLVGTLIDITDVKAVQDTLRESEARFRGVTNAMPQIVWTGTPEGHIDYYNQGWYDYTGIAKDHFGDTSWSEVMHPDDLAEFRDQWPRLLAAGVPWEREFCFRRASDGAYRSFLGRGVPIKDERGKVLRWVGTSTDIHDYKELQSQNKTLLDRERAARTEAERISRVKDEFLATLSHELRTPLNAILGWTQVLRGDPANTEDMEAGLATIERNSRAQTQIIEDLLDMSKIISGKIRLNVERLDLATVVEGAVATARPAATAKQIRLQASIDPQISTVSGDSNRLQQVFWNLLSNAIKFTPKGGNIQVQLDRIESHLGVRITDSGEGIAPEFLPAVFDKFRQQDASTTRQHGGLGLGLAIVKQLVELHGGSVQVESEGKGQGATFVVTLPLSALRPAAPEPEAGTQRRDPADVDGGSLPIPAELLHLEGIKVLVVDDEADARALIKRLLADRGAQVTVAGSVAEAMERFQAERPDVLVSDIGMPGEDGFALIRQVRALPAEQGSHTPAVALTAYARTEDRLKVILAGFQAHMAKPVEAAELLALVASLAGRVAGH